MNYSLFSVIHLYYKRGSDVFTAWKVCKYGGISGLYFPIFGLNTD